MTNTGGAGRAGAEAVTAAWRAESARLVAALARMTRDIELAEDVAQDALVAALEEWPERGIPANPAAWLMTAAKRRAIDHIRRAETLRRKTEEIGHRLEEVDMPDFAGQVDFIEDDVLRLMFLTCHPQLAPASRAALTLRLVSGLSTAEIARAFLVPEATMAQRISRAKKTLVGADMELPMGAERVARLDDVLAAIYLTFNEGYVATAGTDWTRPDLCFEAIRLARMVAAMVPDIPDSLGLQALVELQASRIPARVDRDGAPVLLDDQDRARWDHLLRRRGLQVLARAEKLAAAGAPVGTYFLQAAIAACHARATRSEDTDWQRVADLYDVLALAAPGPVVEVNRAVAHGRAYGAEAGLAVLDALGPDPLPRSPLPHAVRGDLLERLGQAAEASAAFTRAAELCCPVGPKVPSCATRLKHSESTLP
ncbi:RNA polymerase sigma factor [Mycolicibacterium phocaicum]|uniref:RNA polymerase sigma factor n=1 Tax=Mycolicibacterium phocaicum TaxID=319706 RepID=UPI001CFC13C4|nr:sigma-70 family RNA polymerase sigma factor [Mycolicibacterium phocaicum]UCZ61451.1 sigma-70 family RNA polymerase sigma factor [Mycolicibacterium phocaicum]